MDEILHIPQEPNGESLALRLRSRAQAAGAAIQAGDRDPRPIRAGGAQGVQPSSQEDQRVREDMERIRRLMEQMKQEE